MNTASLTFAVIFSLLIVAIAVLSAVVDNRQRVTAANRITATEWWMFATLAVAVIVSLDGIVRSWT